MHSSGPYNRLAEFKLQEQERSIVNDGETETESQVEHSKGDGSPAYPSNRSQTDARMQPSSFDLSHTKLTSSSPPRPIRDFGRILYPEGISSPSTELNTGIKSGKFRYDRSFLMQFQAVCKDKPLTLAPLHDIGLGFLDPNSSAATTSGRSNYHPSPALLALLGPKASSTSSVFGVTSVSEVNNSPLKQPPPKQPLLKQQPPNQPLLKQHPPNQPPSNQPFPNHPPPNQPRPNQPSVPSVFGMVQLVELIKTAPPELVDTAVESLLGGLNKDNVDMVSDDIARWANKSKGGRDSTLDQVICLVVKNAIDNPTQSDTYAQLCVKLRAQVSGKVRDDVKIDTQGKNVGGLPFQTRLVARCKEHFDRDWNVMEVIMTGVVSSETVHVVNKKGEDGKGEDGVDESKLASLVSESDKRQAAKQARRLGLIKFTVELFKVQMVGKDVIHQYAKRLIEANNPGDQRIEGLCELLKQVYFTLDGPKDRTKMDGYFRFMEELGKRPGISPHIRSILQGVRERRQE